MFILKKHLRMILYISFFKSAFFSYYGEITIYILSMILLVSFRSCDIHMWNMQMRKIYILYIFLYINFSTCSPVLESAIRLRVGNRHRATPSHFSIRAFVSRWKSLRAWIGRMFLGAPTSDVADPVFPYVGTGLASKPTHRFVVHTGACYGRLWNIWKLKSTRSELLFPLPLRYACVPGLP